MTTKEAIKYTLSKGLVVTVSYKKKLTDWYSDIRIFTREDGKCVIIGEHSERFDSEDKGVAFFVERFVSGKNVGYVLTRVLEKGIIDGDEMEANLDRGKKQFLEPFRTKLNDAIRSERKLIRQEMEQERRVCLPEKLC